MRAQRTFLPPSTLYVWREMGSVSGVMRAIGLSEEAGWRRHSSKCQWLIGGVESPPARSGGLISFWFPVGLGPAWSGRAGYGLMSRTVRSRGVAAAGQERAVGAELTKQLHEVSDYSLNAYNFETWRQTWQGPRLHVARFAPAAVVSGSGLHMHLGRPLGHYLVKAIKSLAHHNDMVRHATC